MISRCFVHYNVDFDIQIPDRARVVRHVTEAIQFAALIMISRHAWISYMVDKPPSEDPILQTGVRPWEIKEHRPTMTATRARYTPYNT